jgi:hypothetical protein
MQQILLSLLTVVTLAACGSRPAPATPVAATAPAVSHRGAPDRTALVSTPDHGLLAFGDAAAQAIGCSVRFVCATTGFRYVSRPACVAACDSPLACEQACCYTGGVCIYP